MPSEGKKAAEEKRRKALEAMDELREEFVNRILCVMPEEVAEHMGNAQKELLLALKGLVDHQIKKVDRCVERVKDAHKAQ